MSERTTGDVFLGCFAVVMITVIGVGIIFALTIYSNIYGWGLTPQSWITIILCMASQLFVQTIFQGLIKAIGK